MANTITSGVEAEIKRKAEAGIAMDSPTPEKQAIYDAHQARINELVTQKALSGQPLDFSNDYKNALYQQARQGATPTDSVYYAPDLIMGRQQDVSGERMAALEEMLRSGANSQFAAQDAILKQTLENQLNDLRKSLDDAITEGQISVREAEAQFEASKKQIEQQHYRDSQVTNLQGEARGIANSQQMMGMMASDNARNMSLINENMTTRDRRVNDIRDRLNNIKNKTSLDMANANAGYGYASAAARAQADAQMYQNMFGMHHDNYRMDREQQFALDQAGLQQQYVQQNMQSQHAFDLDKMSVSQRYTLEQMAKSFGYDLKKMDVSQQYQLAQMAQSFGYDLSKMQAAFGYDSALQSSQQSFQAGQNALNREHDFNMLSAKQRADVESMQSAMEAELRSYGDPNSPEYQLRQYQLQSSIDALYHENHAKMMSDIMGKSFADFVGNPPVLPKNATRAQIDKYNSQVDAFNSKLESYFENPANISTFFNKLDKAAYSDTVKKAFGTALNEETIKGQLHSKAQNGETIHGAFLEGLKKLFGGGTP